MEEIVPTTTPYHSYEHTQEVFLPVHGHVRLLPPEMAIINHPAFQRLRRVRQLGFAHLIFPGGSHTRFEHSIGAVHVAERIIKATRENHEKDFASGSDGAAAQEWRLTHLDGPVRKFIRLGALLHDIGHLPFGHTLEDELHHLPQHDGANRLALVSERGYLEYDLNAAGLTDLETPSQGWSLRDLIGALYRKDAKQLGENIDPFELLTAIVTKEPDKGSSAHEAWKKRENSLSTKLPLKVCQDIVGNTICADFLDYLFRDWHHLGKPHFEEKRIYEYMETRTPDAGVSPADDRFVINVGEPNKVRHDAITSILELLDARYKLAETVLFHRTKLALTGLLDRCLLEASHLYDQAGAAQGQFANDLEELLLDAADDELHSVLERLLAGNGPTFGTALTDAVNGEREALATQTEQPELQLSAVAADATGDISGPLAESQRLARALALRLKHRQVYTLAYKLRISDFPGPPTPDNSRVQAVLGIYQDPAARRKFLSWLELLCKLPRGTLIMYCPPSAKMNAKVAKANLLVDGEVVPFADYEDANPEGLTSGALGAQIGRFYQLWSAQIFVHKPVWNRMSVAERHHLTTILETFLFRMRDQVAPAVSRANIQASINVIASSQVLEAARQRTSDPQLAELADAVFPSGLPFSNGTP